MNINAEDIFVIPIFNRWVLHAPLHGTTALVSEVFLDCLRDELSKQDGGNLSAMLSGLSGPPPHKPEIRKGEPDHSFFGIIPTRACNMSCGYCGFGAVRAKSIILERNFILGVLDWIFAYSKTKDRDSIDLHFFGGEPFSVPDLVEAIVRHARDLSRKIGPVPKIQASTNGVFDEKCCHFIRDTFDSVVLSFDGPEEIQNFHRPLRGGTGSFKVVSRNASMLAHGPAELSIRICVTQDSVSSLDRISKWMCETFRPSFLNFESLQPTPESEQSGIMPADPWEFAKGVFEAFRISMSYGVVPVYNSADTANLRSSFCPVGGDALIISPDGHVNACYLLEEEWQRHGLDLSLGKFTSDGKLVLDRASVERVRKLTDVPEHCRSCFCRWHCAGGCHVRRHSGQSEINQYFCIQTRILSACNLLQRLGLGDEAARFIASRESMEKLALQRTDSLHDWQGSPV